MITRFHHVPNGDGWKLALKQIFDPATLVRGRRPVAIIPGYGMNAFIFGYHPTGSSMEEFIVSQGFEVWSVNLRNQGESQRIDGSKNYTIGDIALKDLAAALAFIAEKNENRANEVDGIGCSLGGTYLFAYAALSSVSRLGAIVSMGGPLRWAEIHPALRIAFGSERVAGSLSFSGTRKVAGVLLPLIVRRAPWLLKMYLHPEIVDTSKSKTLVQTVEDPNPSLNREIARWIRTKDLIIEGENVTERLSAVKNPLLCMVANADGIVPKRSVVSAVEAIGGEVKDVIVCGNEKVRMAHADMFVSEYSQELVFKPLCAWLASRYEGEAKRRPSRSSRLPRLRRARQARAS